MAIKLVADSGSDITNERAKEIGLTVLPLRIMFGEKEYIDNVTMTHEEFFRELETSGIFPKTSQVTPAQYEEVFAKLVENGDEVLCITLSGKLSGCFSSANIAAEEFPGRVYVVDSENVAIAEGLIVERAQMLIEQGLSAKEIKDILDVEKKKLTVIAKLDTLEYLKKGGRIGKVAAAAGTLLAIKPIVTVDEGEVILVGKARGTKAANVKMTELIEKAGINFDLPVTFAYSGSSSAELEQYKKDNSHLYANASGEIPVSSIGCAIGTHIGPGTIAMAFFRTNY